jgi:MoxR-like ATPase
MPENEALDLVSEYLALDPAGDYFNENSVSWSTEFKEAVSTVKICGIEFERLLGTRESVPSLDEGFFPLGDMVEPFKAALECGLNFAITGHAGTGKSVFVEQMASRLNRPFFVADIHEDYRAETLFGEYKPTDDGRLTWKDGPISEGLKNDGSFVLLDEANMGQPAVLACAHRVLAGGNIFLHDKAGASKEVQIDKCVGVTFTMACNALNSADDAVMYNDTKEMNRAFLDRWGVVCNATYPSHATEVAILQKKLERKFPTKWPQLLQSGIQRKIEQLVRVANAIRGQIDTGDIQTAFSLRRTEGVCKLMAFYGGTITKAIHLGVLNREDYSAGKAIDALFVSEFGGDYVSKYDVTTDF